MGKSTVGRREETEGGVPIGTKPARPDAVDPEVVQVLSEARSGLSLCETLRRPTELWEMLQLIQADPMILRRALHRSPELPEPEVAPGTAETLISKLDAIHDELGPWISRLRRFLAEAPGPPAEAGLRELVIGFIILSPTAREEIDRWVREPVGRRDEAAEKLKLITTIVKTYRDSLGGWSAASETMEPAEFEAPGREDVNGAAERPPAPAAPLKPSTITRILPRGVKSEILDDVRLVHQCLKIFQEMHLEVEVWEGFSLVMIGGDRNRALIRDLVSLKEEGRTEAFLEGTRGLLAELETLRARDGSFVRGLRTFLGELPVGRFGTETREIALGFIVASSEGRERAELWLSDPAHYRQEAATRFEGVIGRAMNYQAALRMGS